MQPGAGCGSSPSLRTVTGVTGLKRDTAGPRLELPLSSLGLFLPLISTNENERPFKEREREMERAMWPRVVEGAGAAERNVSVSDPVTTGITILKIDSRYAPAGTGRSSS